MVPAQKQFKVGMTERKKLVEKNPTADLEYPYAEHKGNNSGYDQLRKPASVHEPAEAVQSALPSLFYMDHRITNQF